MSIKSCPVSSFQAFYSFVASLWQIRATQKQLDELKKLLDEQERTVQEKALAFMNESKTKNNNTSIPSLTKTEFTVALNEKRNMSNMYAMLTHKLSRLKMQQYSKRFLLQHSDAADISITSGVLEDELNANLHAIAEVQNKTMPEDLDYEKIASQYAAAANASVANAGVSSSRVSTKKQVTNKQKTKELKKNDEQDDDEEEEEEDYEEEDEDEEEEDDEEEDEEEYDTIKQLPKAPTVQVIFPRMHERNHADNERSRRKETS